MANKRSLVEMVQAKLDSGEVQLPVLNPVAAQLQDLLGESEFDLDKATELISHDQTLASQVLRMATSAFFSGSGRRPPFKKPSFGWVPARQRTWSC